VFEHAVDACKEFTHDGDDALGAWFCLEPQMLIKTPELGFVLHGHQRGMYMSAAGDARYRIC